MTILSCGGLDGTNPLHFLASLGVLRLLTLNDTNARMSWAWRTGWRPAFCWGAMEDVECADPIDLVAGYLGAWLRELGSIAKSEAKLDREIRKVAAELKKLRENRMIRSSAAYRRHLGKASKSAPYTGLNQEIVDKEHSLERSLDERHTSFGAGIAHTGDIIGVPARVFRSKAEVAVAGWLEPPAVSQPGRNHPVLVAEALSSQASDVIIDRNGNVKPTPYSFSNGGCGQCLLKDFRGCAVTCTNEMVAGLLLGTPITSERVTGLNWDPADQRSYALQWQDPAAGAIDDPAANALAFVGMTQLTAMPVGPDLRAVGWEMGHGKDGFVWPIWGEIIGLEEIRALLGITPKLAERPQDIANRGVYVVLKSTRINPNGKRYFFAPATPL